MSGYSRVQRSVRESPLRRAKRAIASFVRRVERASQHRLADQSATTGTIVRTADGSGRRFTDYSPRGRSRRETSDERSSPEVGRSSDEGPSPDSSVDGSVGVDCGACGGTAVERRPGLPIRYRCVDCGTLLDARGETLDEEADAAGRPRPSLYESEQTSAGGRRGYRVSTAVGPTSEGVTAPDRAETRRAVSDASAAAADTIRALRRDARASSPAAQNRQRLRQELERLTTALGLPSRVRITAKSVYDSGRAAGLQFKFGVDGLAAAATYLGARLDGLFRDLDRVGRVARVDATTVAGAVWQVRTTTDVSVEPVAPGQVVPQLVADLDLPPHIVREARDVIDRAPAERRAGRKPQTVAAASVYLVVRRSADLDCPQAAVAARANVTQGTVSKAFRLLADQ
jgi:transcription initiation factor TFIIIB Brf1 subunit/transcription initiation factor TFIIB